jgi:carbonic anhydrase
MHIRYFSETALSHLKTFVEQKGYEKYLTDKYPDKKLAVLSCMDTRLTVRF